MEASEGKKLSLLEHLRELRRRLIYSVIAVGITTILAFVFADRIFAILTAPAAGITLIYIEMTEMFSIYMKVCLAAGVIGAMPVITYQFLRFVTPGLTPKEKRAIYLILPWVSLMFAGGVVFSYFVLLPPAMKFLFSFGTDIAVPQIRIGNYITIVTRLMLIMGLIFEMPVVTTFLARIGVVTSKWLAKKRRIFVIVAFIVAAIVTPTMDPFTQTLLAVPLIALYEMGIWLAKVAERRRRRAQSVALAASSPTQA